MVEITYQMVLSTLQTVGLLVGITYYIMDMRNAQKNRKLTLKAQEHATETRELDLFMRWQEPQTDPEWWGNFLDILFMEWDDFDDFQKKFDHSINAENASKRFAQWKYWGGLGYLLSRGVIDPDTVFEMGGDISINMWGHFESIIKDFRKRDNNPGLWRWFEYLVNEMKKVRDERELGTYVPAVRLKPPS